MFAWLSFWSQIFVSTSYIVGFWLFKHLLKGFDVILKVYIFRLSVVMMHFSKNNNKQFFYKFFACLCSSNWTFSRSKIRLFFKYLLFYVCLVFKVEKGIKKRPLFCYTVFYLTSNILKNFPSKNSPKRLLRW